MAKQNNPSSDDETKEQLCGWCEQAVEKIWRVERGLRYCQRCYQRLFKPRVCPGCGQTKLLPKKPEGAVCRECEKAKPCPRCQRTGRRLGKLTCYGPVCNSCYQAFRTLEHCDACGEMKPIAANVQSEGRTRRICVKCLQAETHGTCQACRRARRLHEAADGRRLCKICLEEGTKACSKCREQMPAGFGQICEICYRRDLLERRLAIGQAALSSEILSEAFVTFGHWLLEEVGALKASVTIDNHREFFIALDERWNCVPTYVELTAHFQVRGLRKAELPMRWLTTTGRVMVDANEKRDEPERRRIRAAIDRQPPGSEGRRMLEGYLHMLDGRRESKKMSLRSMRFAVSAAGRLLTLASEANIASPEQSTLNAYLKRSPGQRTTIWGFVNYLRELEGADLEIPPSDPDRSKRNRRRGLDVEVKELAAGWSGSEEDIQRWLFLGLIILHDLPRNTARRLSRTANAVRGVESGYSVRFKKEDYPLPARPPPTRRAQQTRPDVFITSCLD